MKMLLLDHSIPYSLKIGTTRVKSLLRKIPRTITRAGGNTFPSGLLYKPLFLVLNKAKQFVQILPAGNGSQAPYRRVPE